MVKCAFEVHKMFTLMMNFAIHMYSSVAKKFCRTLCSDFLDRAALLHLLFVGTS